MSKQKKKPTGQDYDSPWKQIFTDYFEDGIAFIVPPLHLQIDWSRPVEFMEQELYEAVKTRFRGAKLCDKLAKVYLVTGEPLFLLVHIEIESAPKTSFAKRFFWYRVLIFDKHKTENIYSLAIFTNDPPSNQPGKYEFRFLDNRVLFEYPVFKIAVQEETNLLKSENIFALFVLAQQYANKSKNDMEQRLAFRKKLFDLAQVKKISRQRIWQALIFVRYLTTLPGNLEIEYGDFARERLQIKSRYMIYSLEDVRFLDSIVEETTGQSLSKLIEKAQEEARQAREKAKEATRKARAEARETARKAREEARQIKREAQKLQKQAQKLQERAQLEAQQAQLEAQQAQLEAQQAQQEIQQAQQEIQQAQQEIQQAQAKARQLFDTIRKCYFQRKWSVEEIVNFFGLEEAEVKTILQEKE